MRFDMIHERFTGSAAGRWYAAREPNEQRIVLALAILVAVSLLWLLLWKPISDWRATEGNRYQNAQTLMDWMEANEARAREVAAGAATANSERALLPVITRTAEVQGIRINRLQPESNNSVSISIQGQPFNELIRWLHQLEENNGVLVQRISIDAEGRPGLVNAQIRLQ